MQWALGNSEAVVSNAEVSEAVGRKEAVVNKVVFSCEAVVIETEVNETVGSRLHWSAER